MLNGITPIAADSVPNSRPAGSRLRSRRHAAAAFGRTEALLARAGRRRAIIGARFGPVAGMLGVPARFFLLWQAAGALLWTAGTTLLAYGAGRAVPGIGTWINGAVTASVLLIPAAGAIRAVRSRHISGKVDA
jgi:membrane-associated protein